MKFEIEMPKYCILIQASFIFRKVFSNYLLVIFLKNTVCNNGEIYKFCYMKYMLEAYLYITMIAK